MGKLAGKRILIAGTGSGCGKTTAVCGILYGLKKRGLRAAAWKSGPDYIDPMFHKRVLGIGSGNLDLFFSGENGVRSLLAERAACADISVIEGAMGYYDGIGMTQEASCHALAEATKTPVILVVNPRGMGSSVFATIHGFRRYREQNRITGILFNEVSGRRYETLKRPVQEMGLRAVGYLPRQTEFVLESRHLGLVTADEVPDFRQKTDRFYEVIRDAVDWEALLQIAETAEDVDFQDTAVTGQWRDVTIGIARDEAFCFLYEDNVRYLRKRGCRIVWFSPLRDRALPAGIDGLILCGGYPELYARMLSANEGMKRAVKEAILSGMPCIAECGGFLYLQKSLADPEERDVYEMAGLFPGEGHRGKALDRFGYITMSLQEGSLFGSPDMTVRAHEFHYYGCGPECDGVCQSFLAQKASGDGQWTGGWARGDLYAGFPHIYFYGNEAFAEGFLERARAYGRRNAEEGVVGGTKSEGME